MQEKPPSRSARRVAEFRAVHQILENGAIFQDTFAKLMLDEDVRVIAGRDATVPVLRSIRLFMAVRSRFTEDTLAAAVARGVQHAVALGAGLDTFFLRNSYPNSKLRVFELDSPGTQAWKLARLAQAAISIPPSVSFIPINFEHDARIRVVPLDPSSKAPSERDVVLAGVTNLSGLVWAADSNSWFVSVNTTVGNQMLYAHPDGQFQSLGDIQGWAVPSPDGRKVAFLNRIIATNAWMIQLH